MKRVCILFVLLTSILAGCKKEVVVQYATITTTAVTSVTTTTASSGGTVASDGGATVTTRGIFWGTNPNPTMIDLLNSATSGTGTGSFTCSITGLSPGTTYYVTAFAINSKGSAFGNTLQFNTTAVLPTLSTTAVSAITSSTAASGGNITASGGATISGRGVCWSTNQNPTIADSKTSDATGTGTFTSAITGLVPVTLYYARAYATNSVGTTYGQEVSFTTLAPSYPGTTLLAVKSGGIWWAPVNCGYAQTTLPYGLLFQWNRKYGQDYVTTGVVPGGVTLIVGNDVANKDLFYAHSVTYFDWASTWQAVWNEYSPCPTGWRVPTQAEIVALSDLGSTWVNGTGVDNLNGRWFAGNHNGNHVGSIFLPAGGHRNYDGLYTYYRGLAGYYWSSNNGQDLTLDENIITYTVMTHSSTFNSYGFSVRCVQN